MPRIRSAKKRLRQARSHAQQNKQRRSQLRTALKKVRAAGTAKEAQVAYAKAAQLLDRAGRTNLVHRNAAARQKSRLAKVVKSKG